MDYGIWLAGVIHAPVTLLGIVEIPADAVLVNRMIDEAAQRLVQGQIPHQVQLSEGRGPIVIARYSSSNDGYLTIFGPLGRPAWRRVLLGRSFRRVLELVCDPVLYVRQSHQQLKRILICLGGLGYSGSVIHLCLYLARETEAEVTLLHIVEPVTLQYPIAEEVRQHWKHLEDTNTPQGRNLRKAFEIAQASGLQATYKVRHGNTVHEIIDEVKTGGYDLIGMGSPYSSHSLRHLYMPNVTAEVAEDVHCPVLAVRQGHSLMAES